MDAKDILADWGDDAKEIAQLVIDKYGDPDEVMPSMLLWHHCGKWLRTIVHKKLVNHDFPIPHKDGVEQFVAYKVPVEKIADLAVFDGSVVVFRTKGEMSACCHDEEANLLALNLAHDIITHKKTVSQARDAYAQAMLDFRRGEDVRYMEELQFPQQDATEDADARIISEKQIEQASQSA